jgi:hypothetical protein
MITVGRYINGISLNELEYLLDENDDVMEFANEEEAKTYLRNAGVSEEEMYYMVFEKAVRWKEATENES